MPPFGGIFYDLNAAGKCFNAASKCFNAAGKSLTQQAKV
jgi:hypothetical protein